MNNFSLYKKGLLFLVLIFFWGWPKSGRPLNNYDISINNHSKNSIFFLDKVGHFYDDFFDWIIQGFDQKLIKDQYYVLYQVDNHINAISVDGKNNIQISKNGIFFASQVTYDGKLIALYGQDKEVYVDLAKMKSSEYAECKSVDCFTRGGPISLSWSVIINGDQKDKIDFTNFFDNKKISSVLMPKKNNDYPNWSFDGKQLALVQADLEIMDQQQRGSIYFIDTSCLGFDIVCTPQIKRSFTLDNYPMWGGITSAWSPDNKYFAFVNVNKPEDIIIVDKNNEYKRIVNKEKKVITRIFWSPDGKNLLVYQESDAIVVNVSTGETTLLFSNSLAEPIGWLSTYRDPVFQIGNNLSISGAGNGITLFKDHSLKSSVIRELNTPEDILLEDGPYKIETKIWWKITVQKDNSQGWIMENPDWFVLK